MRRQLLAEATVWITEEALRHPQGLAERVAERLAVKRASAARLLSRLVEAQWLVREGPRRRTVYRPGPMRQVVRRYLLADLKEEDLPWRRDFVPLLEAQPLVSPQVSRIAQYIFTELLNNAIDHSAGTRVTVSLRQTATQLQLLVSDDGRGVFDTLCENFALDDPALAMFELAKGKLTTQPERHTGRGLFFCTKLSDIFTLHANDAAFQQRDWQRDEWRATKPACRQGSSVYAAVSLDTERTVDEVLRRYSADGAGYGFERTVVPLALLTGPHVDLDSRSQARRVAKRLAAFRRADLDFGGLSEVGHAFADELFRVYGERQPGLSLVPVNAAPRVAAVIDSIRQRAG
jgi:anti-sigma regulatory factor (Ser/Thr protein kinase)